MFFSSKRDKRLRRLIKTYSDSFSQEKRSLRDFKFTHQAQRTQSSHHRFKQDLATIGETLICHLELPQSKILDVTSVVSRFSDESTQAALKTLFGNSPIALTQERLPESSTEKENKNESLLVLQLILDQVIEEGRVPNLYDFSYIDDIVPIVKSRYQGDDGTTLTSCSEQILHALWQCTGNDVKDYCDKQVAGKINTVLSVEHRYQPKRFPIPFNSSISEAREKELRDLNAPENPERFLKICGDIFDDINQKTEDGAADRELSILYGYEMNHHLLLRTLLGLKSKGCITKEDRVLVLGPRHVHEIEFFREFLNLPKTIGLDLVGDGDIMIAGDMHNIPFEANTFKLIYFANTLPYAYDMRQVLKEMNRVLEKPGYIAGFDRCNSTNSPHPLGRSDVINLETALTMYYEFPHSVLAADEGRTDDPQRLGDFPNYVIEFM